MIILLLIVSFFALLLIIKNVQLNSTIKKNNNLIYELKKLEKYQNVLDAEQEAQKIINIAKETAADLTTKADSLYHKANQEYENKIKNAELDAQKIAGDAYDTKMKAEFYQNTVTSLKNIIEGYGNRYIIPTNSLIDQLAENYSHTQAGEELKKVREEIRSMIKNNSAAECDYVETNRKETAVNFIMDAFNGKVDTIIANVKETNVGTLNQKIKDSFQLVNNNGKAFRNARITEEYLKLRLNELRLASIIQAIKEKEKEEQRQIREQIREEEKAAKEYEKALREAQKEEETVAKAMNKIKKEIETANEQKRIQYEEKLKELEEKLKEVEEKNKRAQSMAELTKSGHVYIISNIGSFGENVLKIGMTRRLDPLDRIYELGDASVPFDFDVHAMIYSEDAPALEKELHKKFFEKQINKVNIRKEFFNIEIHIIKTEIERMGINAHWTMLAEAREYRESLAILSINNNQAA